jgi:hypothetical protein
MMDPSEYRSAILGRWYYSEAGRRVMYAFHEGTYMMNELARGGYRLTMKGTRMLLTMLDEEVIVVNVNTDRMIWLKGDRQYVLTRS